MVFLFYFGRMNICFNGKLVLADHPILLASNRGYRYGDGLFETMKIIQGNLLFFDDHMERFFDGLRQLQYQQPPLFTKEHIAKEILELCHKNKCAAFARVRLSVFRGNGGLYDEDKALQYIIECWPLGDSVGSWNENGLVIGLSAGPRKSCDSFSNLKTANFLPYSWAAVYAKANQWNDCLVLNSRGPISDSTIANCFIIKDKQIITPSLDQGCVSGIMRKQLVVLLRKEGYEVNEGALTVEQLLAADEVFLSNTINGIRWVRHCEDARYNHSMTREIYQQFSKTISR
jgi:branched-chain amino acid aminotransferase